MAPASNSSSLEPHNGSASAQSNSRQSPRRHGSSHHHGSRHSHRNHAHVTNNVNGNHHSEVQAHEPAYTSAYTYAMYPREPAVPVPPEISYHEDQIYYSSAQFHTYGSGPYDCEIRLEEEQPPAAPAQIPQHNSYPSGVQYLQTPTEGHFRPQTPVQQYSTQQQNVATSATTSRWSRQQLAEERLRLGLPRFATQEEVEAARRAYEEATQQASQ